MNQRVILLDRILAVVAPVALVVACRAGDAPRTPEETCRAACESRAATCSSDQCATGCNLVLDRLAEHEGDAVVACVAAAHACDLATTWAPCATRVGPHADGGPPAPPPAQPR